PDTSAQIKIDAVRGFGATVDLIDTTKIARNARVEQLAARMPRAYFASAYADQLVVDGNATLGAELAKHNFDIVVSPIGGGGLISGLITGLRGNGSSPTFIGGAPLL